MDRDMSKLTYRDFPGCIPPSPPFGSLVKNPVSGPSATVTNDTKNKQSDKLSKVIECKSNKAALKKATELDKKSAVPINDPTRRKKTSPITSKKRVESTTSVTEVEKGLDKLKVHKDKNIEKTNPASVQPKILVKIPKDKLPNKPKGLNENNSDEVNQLKHELKEMRKNQMDLETIKQSVKAEVLAEMTQGKKDKRKEQEEPMEVEQCRKKLKMERIEKQSSRNQSYDEIVSRASSPRQSLESRVRPTRYTERLKGRSARDFRDCLRQATSEILSAYPEEIEDVIRYHFKQWSDRLEYHARRVHEDELMNLGHKFDKL